MFLFNLDDSLHCANEAIIELSWQNVAEKKQLYYFLTAKTHPLKNTYPG